MTAPILIVEDEIKLAQLLRDYCDAEGYDSVMIHDGDEALAWLGANTARLVLLDLMLPGSDGYSICRNIRQRGDTPVIMTTARVEEIDRLLGLELGADDYICKPYSPREVIARIKAILRRVEKKPGSAVSTLNLDEAGYRVTHAQRQVELTAVEFKLFKTLFQSPGRIYSRDLLMSLIYEDHRIVVDRTIDSHVKKLRKKLETLALPFDPLHSVYGVGYKYEPV